MLINCAAYQNGKKLGDIRKDEIHEYLNRSGCFVWVALKDGTPEELAELKQQFGLHELAVEDAHHGHQRPKIEEYGDSLFMVLHMIEPVGGELRVGELSLFVASNYVLSVRSRSEQGFASVRARTEREPHLLKHGAAFVFYALIDTVVDRYFPVLDAVEDELESVESRMFDGSPGRENIEALYAIKQKLMVLKHAVGPLHEAVGRLYGGRVPAVCAKTEEYFRDVGDHLLRLNQSIDSLRDMVITALSVNLSMITIGENETVKRLASYAALVAVPTMIAGVYGMNFKHMPELDWVWGYPFAVGLMVAIDAYLFWRFRKAKWL
ncbi:MAG TPA: magnesium/cobalt transporter CorA [Burkholderiales bacterium]|nr:magnesium/cobalt transporter CorA [Burkholderiales bacterium]